MYEQIVKHSRFVLSFYLTMISVLQIYNFVPNIVHLLPINFRRNDHNTAVLKRVYNEDDQALSVKCFPGIFHGILKWLFRATFKLAAVSS